VRLSQSRQFQALLINNKATFTAVGVYAQELYKHMLAIAPSRVRFANLIEEGKICDEPSLYRLASHLRILWKFKGEKEGVVFHFMTANLGVGAVHYRPSVVTLHDLIPFIPALHRLRIATSKGKDLLLTEALKFGIRLAKYSNLIISPSQSTKNDAVKLFSIDARKIVVIYPGVNHQLFVPRDKTAVRSLLQLPLRKKIILNVSVDEPRKNLVTVLYVLKKVVEKSPDVILVRIGKQTENTTSLIRKLCLQEHVINIPRTDRIELFYNAADTFLLPTLYEGVGYPLLEAMSSGCPIVSSNVSSVPEILGKVGVKCNPLDVEEISASLGNFLFANDPMILKEEIEKGLERSKLFDWKECAMKTFFLYELVSQGTHG
jgi:glycosyltransferase involved in cell wall biosynthesis